MGEWVFDCQSLTLCWCAVTCTHVCTVRMSCTHALYACAVHMYCTHALYACTVRMCCTHALYTCTVRMHKYVCMYMCTCCCTLRTDRPAVQRANAVCVFVCVCVCCCFHHSPFRLSFPPTDAPSHSLTHSSLTTNTIFDSSTPFTYLPD